MSESLVQPPSASDKSISGLLIDRVDKCHLGVGMVIGITDAGSHRVIPHGWTDRTARCLFSDSTICEIGSLTKLFTAVLLCDMVNGSEVELDEPIAKLLPAGIRVPHRNGKAIVLRDLASHYSGLPRLPTNFEPTDWRDPYAHYTAELLYEFLAAYELGRTPGDTYEYSNLGPGLLGHALSLRAGTTYENLVRSRILIPLGMNDTGLFRSKLQPERRFAQGHDDSLDPVPNWHFNVLEGAGALHSSLSDLLRLCDVLIDPSNTPLEHVVPMLLASRDNGGLEMGSPYADGDVALSHSGGTGGFRSFIRCIPQWKKGVAVLSNSSIDAVDDLGGHALDPRMGLRWYRTETTISPCTLPRLVGRYQLAPNSVFEITSSHDRLYAQLTGQQGFRLFPTSEWQFFYKVVGAQITFQPGPDGRAARLILHQNSLDQIAERIE